MRVFYTSDTHFNEDRTFNYSMRGMYFDSLEQSTEEMIRRWNEVVSEDDIVYHLGDFGDFDVAKRLNGHIILLYGNYERDGAVPNKEQSKQFLKIIEGQGLSTANVIMVHEPKNRLKVHISENTVLFATPIDDRFYLFGHIHEKQKVKRNGLNVGVDVHNFTPVSTETVEFYRNAIQNIYDDNCFNNY